MGERGPHRRHLTEEQIEFLQLYYKTKGREFCARQLGMAQTTLRYKLQIWREERGEIEFVERRPIPQHQRRLFGGPIQKHNSCQRWGEINNRRENGRSLEGRRIG